MGKIERRIRAGIRKTKINKAILAALAVGGIFTVGTLAPNILGVAAKWIPQRRQNVKRSLTRLIENGYVAVEAGGLQKRFYLTKKGERFAALLGEGRLAPKKPRRWDGKWRILIFDIPERRRRLRDQTRVTLVNLGFYRLQDSVWVYPYDCEDLITLFKVDFRVGKDLLYIVADAVEHDTPLKQHFRLD